MTQRAPRFVALLILIAALCMSSPASAAPLDGALPVLPVSPVTVPLTAGDSALYRVSLVAGETLALSLSPASGAPATLDLDLYLYGPAATTNDRTSHLAAAKAPVSSYPETIAYQALESGTYYVEIFASEQSGSGGLTWQIVPEQPIPVHRFYNVRTGTHFYTPDEAERANIQATLGSTYRYEGVAYTTKASRNDQVLHRFYNRRTGTHFYTADEAEKARVLGTLGGTYSYDGPTYKVSLSATGKLPVYRFYNAQAGTHFYTADEAERNNVINTLGWKFTYEGAAFYLGQ